MTNTSTTNTSTNSSWIIPFDGVSPQVDPSAFIAPTAVLTGQVSIAANVSIFFGAVLRGDLMPIEVGANSNIQEHALLHTTSNRSPVKIGEWVTVGHRAIIHGCQIKNRCLIGMGAIILDDTVIEEDCLIGAGTVVTEKQHIPARSLVLGVPGKVIRELSDAEVKKIPHGAKQYVEVGRKYREYLATTKRTPIAKNK